MDYVVGGVAALLSGNVTPNRPKVLKRARTPTKHQPSPNVTPKSESVTDRSIFLSPTMQKKKAIVKKSPKRIFQNPDLDSVCINDSTSISPKADKVKKHLEDKLDADNDVTKTILSPKSPKNKLNKSLEAPSKMKLSISGEDPDDIQVSNEVTPKKKKKKVSLITEAIENYKDDNQDVENLNKVKITPKKRKTKYNEFTVSTIEDSEPQNNDVAMKTSPANIDNNKEGMKKLKNCTKASIPDNNKVIVKTKSVNKENEGEIKVKKNKKKHKKNALKNKIETENLNESGDNLETAQSENEEDIDYVNPNAITNQDSDSEHESDDDIVSENEENNKTVLDTGPQESSDEDEEKENTKKEKKSAKTNKEVKEHVESEEDIKRTLFVGNVPFSSKCKKEIKKIFNKYGEIETVRIRTVPVKDARFTPKLAVIKNEIHPDRSTVNVYVKFADPASVDEALAENNTLVDGHHLRVSRSDITAAERDPRFAVFVGNVPFALEEEGLRAAFERCGQIDSVRIVRDRKTNAGKGFGYVNFASKDGVELALALTDEDLTIKNRIMRVKRCNQPAANKQGRQGNKQGDGNNQGAQNYKGKQQNFQGRQQNFQGRQQNVQGRQQNFQGRQQNFQGRQQNVQGRQQNFQGRQQNAQGRQQNVEGRQQNNQGRQQNFQGRQQAQGRFNNRGGQMNRPANSQFGNNRFQRRDQGGNRDNDDAAYRRIMNKRKPQDNAQGPPQKRQKNIDQPMREKKPRKEFVGLTAGKKKFQKRKLSKDQVKKKALGEILMKGRQ